MIQKIEAIINANPVRTTVPLTEYGPAFRHYQ